MEKNIIVPIDFSDISKDVAKSADEWAQRTKGKLHFLHVSQMPEMSYYPAHFEQAEKFDETEHIARLDAFLTPLDLKADREICHEYGTPYYNNSGSGGKGKGRLGHYGCPFPYHAWQIVHGK